MAEWLEPRLGEPLPPELVAWASGQPSLEGALAACERADWVVWLLANNASTAAEQRNAIRVGTMCVLPHDRYAPFRHVLWPRYSAAEMASRWTQMLHDDASVLSSFWLSDLLNALLLAGAADGYVSYRLWRAGWSTTAWQGVGDVVILALTPAFHFLWRQLRRVVNARREGRYAFADGWRFLRPRLETMWARATPQRRSQMMLLSKMRAPPEGV